MEDIYISLYLLGLCILRVTGQCDKELLVNVTARALSIDFPGNSQTYDISLNCNWRFVTEDPKDQILYQISNLNVDCGDVFVVDDDDPQTPPQTICCAGTCSSSKLNMKATPSGELRVKFISDTSHNDYEKGFTLNLVAGHGPDKDKKDVAERLIENQDQVSPPDFCNKKITVTDIEQTLSSPNFPGFYDTKSRCRYEFVSDNALNVTLKIIFHDVESNVKCKNGCCDTINIYNLKEKPATLLDSFCGTSFNPNKTYNGAWLALELDSDDIGVARGFVATVVNDINRCIPNPCKHQGTCVNSAGSFVCQCPPEWTGNLCQTDVDECIRNPCSNQGNCVNTQGYFICECPVEWTGDFCESEISVPVINPVMNSYFEFRCEITDIEPGVSVSWFKDGKTFAPTSDQISFKENRVVIAFASVSSSDDGVYRCVTDDAFKTSAAARVSVREDIDECLQSPCMNQGTCRNTLGSFVCQCPPEWTGNICQTDVDECIHSPCSNEGKCVNTPGYFICECPVEWTGDLCESEVPIPVLNPEMDSYFEFRCEVADIEPGVSISWFKDGNPFTPSPRQIVFKDNKVMIAFSSISTADDGLYRCVTDDAFQTSAATRVSVRQRQDVDECLKNPCMNQGKCRNTVGSFTCRCPPEWTGNVCQTDVDECTKKPCLNQGKCINTQGYFICECPVGWSGDLCDSKVDIPVLTPEKFSKFELTCNIRDIEPGVSINWFKDGKPFRPLPRQVTFKGNKTSVVFESIENKHNGIYKCEIDDVFKSFDIYKVIVKDRCKKLCSKWTRWSRYPCSVSCGGGSRIRSKTRTCSRQFCPMRKYVGERCNPKPCPRNIPMCHYNGQYIPDSEDCTQFYQCGWRKPVLKKCKPGTAFNPKINVCDHIGNIDCQPSANINLE